MMSRPQHIARHMKSEVEQLPPQVPCDTFNTPRHLQCCPVCSPDLARKARHWFLAELDGEDAPKTKTRETAKGTQDANIKETEIAELNKQVQHFREQAIGELGEVVDSCQVTRDGKMALLCLVLG